ncbi:zinc-binding dehydrogenase, partial [Planctomycetota bacterium]
TGGVGQAAVQISQHLGLEIFATAGTPEKRQMLVDAGVPHVMDSRSLDFADQIMEITQGKGVDAVLNSLAGEFIPKSFSSESENVTSSIGARPVWTIPRNWQGRHLQQYTDRFGAASQ